jgi:hypothetical protein
MCEECLESSSLEYEAGSRRKECRSVVSEVEMLWREERQSDGKEEGKGGPNEWVELYKRLPLDHDGGRRGGLTDFLARSTHTQPKVLAVSMIRNAKEDFCSSTTGREGGDDQRFPP